MIQTKSGSERRYSQIETYYSISPLTKSVDDSIPTAYVVNFEDEEGFAVLGANRLVPDIVAITESGKIDPLTLQVTSNPEVSINSDATFVDMDESEIEYFNDNVFITTDSLYFCNEDNDYYDGVSTTDDMATSLIQECLRTTTSDFYVDNRVEGESSSPRYYTKSPLLGQCSWGQTSPYNKYCKRGTSKQAEAFTGCSTTAMAMIVAYNEYPQNLIINDVQIDYKKIKNYPLSLLYDTEIEYISLLMGSIFNSVRKVTTSSYTMITPYQIKKLMQKFGYVNVNKLNASKLNSNLLDAISQMLGNNKPVFISAIPSCWKYGHSWVVDGAKYSANNTYLLHMNFGWKGSNNGYFASECINPSRAESYDDPGNVLNQNYRYSWHFRIITYDVPQTQRQMRVSF